MKASIPCALLAILTLGATFRASQPAKVVNEPLVDKVRTAIKQGVHYLENTRDRAMGHWQDKDATAIGQPGGQTALAVLALLNAGVGPGDENVKAGLAYLRTLQEPSTYVRSLQTMALVEAGQAEDLERIQKNVNHFVGAAKRDANKRLLGWSYDQGSRILPDNSNTQYALLALWVAKQRGIALKKEFWEEVRDFYTHTQSESGGWIYRVDGEAPSFARGETLTMTSAALCGLFMAQMEIAELAADKQLDPFANCGIYEENAAIKKGLAWINSPRTKIDRFTIPLEGRIFYNIYGIERLGRLSGQRFLGQHDWYREGCAWLVKTQQADGSWSIGSSWDGNPIISTSFALLFLSKGRTPVLISKLAHGDLPRLDNDQDWNRRHNDLRHLVDFTSAAVFQKMPLAWQIFDMRRQTLITQDMYQEITSDLLQSPILYITGHESPARRLDAMEKARLKEYVDNGGFILGVACCAKKEFSDGFHELCQELWPNNELTSLDADHPVWTMNEKFQVKPGSVRLKGIQLGCKTVVMLCQDNLTGWWELNRRTGEGLNAFHLGANIIAYATGLEPPMARLTPIPVAAKSKENLLANPPRGYFQIGQLISKTGEKAAWKPAPEAMSKLTQHLREVAGLDAVIKTADVPIDAKDLTKFKFLYMHGRMDFKFSSEQLERLRFNLKNGGLLLADACCGKEAFDKGFRQFIADLFPKEALTLVPIKSDDPLFGEDVNGLGQKLTEANIQCRTERGAKLKPMRPALEGVKIGGRWVVIYSKYDIGCALEKHQSADCLGYSYESALRLGRAAVLYHFWLEPRH